MPSMLPVIHEATVEPRWVDYNGHLTEFAYAWIFSDALTALFDRWDIAARYRERTGCTMYSLENHMVFRREAKLGTQLRVGYRLLDWDAKRLHVLLELYDPDGAAIALYEGLSIHVRQKAGEPPRSAPFPDDVQTRMADIHASFAAEPAPRRGASSISIRRPTATT